MISLVMNPGRPEEQTFSLPVGTLTIGRTKDNAIHCLHKSLSRKHAQVDFDGTTLKITDLQSKNGIHIHGKRVAEAQLVEGDTFRCGDIIFLLEGTTRQSAQSVHPTQHGLDRMVQTLPSPFAADGAKRPPVRTTPQVIDTDGQRHKDKLFLLIRASELCVSQMAIDQVLDELIVLAVQVLEVDRISLLSLDEQTMDLKPRVIKTFVGASQQPYSRRVVDWVLDHGNPASFADVSRDRSLPGDPAPDTNVKGAICVPINPGSGTIGVIYGDSLSRADCFRPDDLALLRALANLAAVAIDSAALRSNGVPSQVTGETRSSPKAPRSRRR